MVERWMGRIGMDGNTAKSDKQDTDTVRTGEVDGMDGWEHGCAAGGESGAG
jgi:hypothetical protein